MLLPAGVEKTPFPYLRLGVVVWVTGFGFVHYMVVCEEGGICPYVRLTGQVKTTGWEES